ncbi:MAG: polysaccharide biosynthesis C-terminal domain-containing protein [Bacteroidota bacterium]
MSVLKKLAGQTVVYGLSSILGRVLNYLLVPLYTSELSGFSLSDYGIVTELYAYVAFLNIIYVYGLETAYFRFSKQGDKKYFHLAFSSILITSLFLSGFLWIFSVNISELIGNPGSHRFIRWLALILGIDAVVAIPFAKLRQDGKALMFASFKLINIVLNISFNLFFILLCPWLIARHPNHFLASIYDSTLGIGYVFLSNLFANATYLFLFIPIWKGVRIYFNGPEWKRLIKYAAPILVIGLAGVTNEMLSRAILKYRLPEAFYASYTNLEILGIFGACYKLSVFMTLAIQAFRYAFEPFLFAQAKEKDSPQLFSKVMTYFVLFTGFSWLILSLFIPYYAPIFLRQDSYLFALDAVPLLLGGGLFLGIFYNLSLWYKLTDQPRFGAIITVAGAVLTFALNWLLIPAFGYIGSAYATFISYFGMMLFSYFWGKVHYPVPYEKSKILIFILAITITIFFNSSYNLSLLAKVTISTIFLGLMYLMQRRDFAPRR